MATNITTVCCRTLSSFHLKINHFSQYSLSCGGQKWRKSFGVANDNLAYGPLTDLPDWSYADGKSAPETKRRKQRQNRRLKEAERIRQFLKETDNEGNTDKQTK